MRCQTETDTFSSVEHNEKRKDKMLMAKQDKPTGQLEEHGRGMLWRILIIGAFLVAILVVAALRFFGSPRRWTIFLCQEEPPVLTTRVWTHAEGSSSSPIWERAR